MVHGKTIALGLMMLTLPTMAREFKLIDDGKSVCEIVVPENASTAWKRAGGELAKYLGKISGGESPAIVDSPTANAYPVRLEIVDDDELGVDGFRLVANSESFRIMANNEQSLYYGVYHALGKYGGIRWLVPGEDGEYFALKPTIAIPEGDAIHKPDFSVRKLELNCASNGHAMTDTWDWMSRNNFTLADAHGHVNSENWRPELAKALKERGARIANSIMFSSLLAGRWVRPGVRSFNEEREAIRIFHLEHPEYFPLVDGERVILHGYEQPCTSNPEVVEIMSRNVSRWAKLLNSPAARLMVINDDGTIWCQCDKCRSSDPKGESGGNVLSTRYWTFINQIFKRAIDLYPNMTFEGMAYQNFQKVPKGVALDPRLSVKLSFNRRCFRHRLADSRCPTNTIFHQYYQDWMNTGNRVSSREEFGAGGGGMYMPLESTLIDGFKTFHDLGMAGASVCTCPVDGVYRPFYDDVVKKSWYSSWQALYLAGQFLWDIDGDYDALLEEANSLYYGPAWEGGMKEFRKRLTKAFQTTPGCYGWGHGAPAGRCLALPGVRRQLLSLLDSAAEAAKNDARALAHVNRDRHLFEITWIKAHDEYMNTFREMNSFAKKGDIQVDGMFEEHDWKRAEVYGNFKTLKDDHGKNKTAEPRTFVRTVHEPECLYVAISALEPTPDKLLVKEGDAFSWGDNALELFLSHPDMNGSYYQLAFNANGDAYESKVIPGSQVADTTFKTGVEIKTKMMKDRWNAELKIPTSSLGVNCVPGHVWRINVARTRKLTDGEKEQSSLANGSFHGAFQNLNFIEEPDVKNPEKDVRLWRNSGFNETFKRPHEKWAAHWRAGQRDLLPRGWSLNRPGVLEMLLKPESDNDYCLKLTGGDFYQTHKGKGEALRIKFKASGRGEFTLRIFNFKRGKYPAHFKTVTLDEIKLDTDDWKDFSYDYEKLDPDDLVGPDFSHVKGEILIDDVVTYEISKDMIGKM